MMWSIAKAAAVAAGAAVLLAACTPKPAVQCDFTPMMQTDAAGDPALLPLTPGTMKPMALNTVSVIDAGIRRKVLVQSVQASRTATGNVAVETRLMNCTDHPLQVDGRTNFLTTGGGSAEAPSMWQRVYLPPRSFASYAESSVSGPNAATFLIEVKEGR